MSPLDKFRELWSDYLEGELSDEGMQQLRALIADQPDYKAIAIEQYQVHRALGLLSQESSEAFIDATLKRVPASSDDFVARVVAKVGEQTDKELKNKNRWAPIQAHWKLVTLAAIAATLLFVLFHRVIHSDTHPGFSSQPKPEAKFTNTARTKFLGSFAPAMDSAAVVGREYILTSGLVQMQFLCGAQVIVQGPAVFKVAEGNRLEMTVGRCSVYCPPGAEGFVVDTPNAHVVDRGTRFYINVVESSATEVHVVDGVADVFAPSREGHPTNTQPAVPATQNMIRLAENQARMIDSDRTFATRPTEFRSSLYQYGLPDRVLSYEASEENGGAKDLISLDVQRGGKVYRLPVEQLVRSKLTWFKIEQKIFDMRHLAGEAQLPEDRQELMLDTSLNTGAINPGGSIEPYQGNPVYPGSSSDGVTSTPGFAIEFLQPVTNGPGPDVVMFELQSVAGAPDGDPFHVLPLQLSDKRRALTIKSYDLTLTSPEVRRPANFYLHEFEKPVDSIDQLITASCYALQRPQGSAGYRVLAVSIDLSAMGFEEYELVEGLFFQDSLDDPNHFDPVGIFGLPWTK